MRNIFLLMMIAVFGAGCAANCKNVQTELDTCKKTLADQDLIIKKQDSTIRQKDQELTDQEANVKKLELQIVELNRKLTITSSEKGLYDERIKNNSFLVREFIKNQIREEREFLTGIDLEDFVGNELIERQNSGESEMMIIDVANPVPSEGQINGIGGYFLNSTDIVVKLLRPLGNDYIVTYSNSLSVTVDKPGQKFVDFTNPLIVKKDDIIAYYFPKSVTVPFDIGLGIGTYSSLKEDAYANGEKVAGEDIWKSNQMKRKYSLNYYGIFTQK